MSINTRIKNIEEIFIQGNKDKLLMFDEELARFIYGDYLRMIAGETIDPEIKEFLEILINKKDEPM